MLRRRNSEHWQIFCVFARMRWIEWERTLTTSTYQAGLKSYAPHLISSSFAIERATTWA